jgi:antitoxin ParD1/3/4
MLAVNFFTSSGHRSSRGSCPSVTARPQAPSREFHGRALRESGSPVCPRNSPFDAHFGSELLAKIANDAKVGLGLTWRAMPTRNVNLTEELDRFVLSKIESGRYENASEVVRAALRTLEREEQEHEAKLAALRAAIEEGDTSGVAGSGVFSRVRKTLKLPAVRR